MKISYHESLNLCVAFHKDWGKELLPCVDRRGCGPLDLGGDVEAQEDVLGLPPLGGGDDYSLELRRHV